MQVFFVCVRTSFSVILVFYGDFLVFETFFYVRSAFANQLHIFSAHVQVFLRVRNYSTSFLQIESFFSFLELQLHVLSANFKDFYSFTRVF